MVNAQTGEMINQNSKSKTRDVCLEIVSWDEAGGK